MEIKSLDETDVTTLGISKLFLDSKKTPFFNKQPTNKSMEIFNSDKHVIVEYFSFFFFLHPQLLLVHVRAKMLAVLNGLSDSLNMQITSVNEEMHISSPPQRNLHVKLKYHKHRSHLSLWQGFIYYLQTGLLYKR